MTEIIGLLGVFLAGFVSATLLPGNSELALIAYVRQFTTPWMVPVLVATLGNTLGAIATYYCARLLPKPNNTYAWQQIQRFGAPCLFFSALPILGDILCAMAGWLRMNIAHVVCWLLAGKLVRYVIVVWLNSLW